MCIRDRSCILFSTVPYDDQGDRPNNIKIRRGLLYYISTVGDCVRSASVLFCRQQFQIFSVNMSASKFQ